MHAGAAVPAFGSGWIAYGGWTDNTGFAITNFQTTWKVPPPPTTSSGQTIFLFNGIQNSTMIYQPVLQWGSSAAGGGAYWAVASWYADGQTGQSFHSSLVRVNPGDTLVGVMALTHSSTAGYSYGCQFTGIANTSLPIQNVEQLTWANETLEVYGITQPSDYPDAFETKMRGISLSTAGSSTSLSWDANDAVTHVGQHCVVVSNSSANGEVDLCYSDHPVAKAQGLAVYNSQLYAVWKGMTADDSVWFSASGNGSSWAAQQRIGGIGSRVGPSLAVFNGPLYSAWKGVGSDQALYFSYFDGVNWAPQALIGGVASRVGPALTNWNGKLYAAWRGRDSDQAIWYSAYDGSNWTAQRTIPGVASSVGPALAGYNARLYAAWKGIAPGSGDLVRVVRRLDLDAPELHLGGRQQHRTVAGRVQRAAVRRLEGHGRRPGHLLRLLRRDLVVGAGAAGRRRDERRARARRVQQPVVRDVEGDERRSAAVVLLLRRQLVGGAGDHPGLHGTGPGVAPSTPRAAAPHRPTRARGR